MFPAVGFANVVQRSFLTTTTSATNERDGWWFRVGGAGEFLPSCALVADRRRVVRMFVVEGGKEEKTEGRSQDRSLVSNKSAICSNRKVVGFCGQDGCDGLQVNQGTLGDGTGMQMFVERERERVGWVVL